MSKKTWAQLDGQRIAAVAESAEPPFGEWVDVTGAWPGWSACPAPTHSPYLQAGAVVWLDAMSDRLAAAKTRRVEVMKAARDAEIFGTFTWDGSAFDADQVSQSRLLGLRLDATLPSFTPRAWRLADNTWRVLSAEDAQGVWLALAQHLEFAFVRFAAREAEIQACETIAQVDAVTWNQPE